MREELERRLVERWPTWFDMNGDKRGFKVRVLTETKTNCSKCGAATTVPFKPTRGTPILCRPCFQGQPQTQIAS
jgi:CxxC-x17-CxxC domain-containing protein